MYQLSTITLPLWIIFIYQFFLLSSNRYRMVRSFVPAEITNAKENRAAIKRMFDLGHRFDIKVLSIIFGSIWLISSAIFYITPTIATGLSIAIFIFCLVLNGIIVGNYYYFKTYNNYYDIFMFGLVEDDTKAVLQNIYEDYPIIRLIIAVLLSALIPAVFIYYAVHQQWFTSEASWVHILFFVITVLGIVFGARGAIRSKPLSKGNAQVSSLNILNKMVPDGLTAMSWAFSDKKRQISFETVTKETGEQLLERMGESKDLYAVTPINDFLAQEKPHVVFALMESFGKNILISDDEQNNDLLGRLRPFWQKGFVFERFCSDYDGTAPSLANLFFHSSVQNISQSIAQNKALKDTPFNVYKSQGYKTVFITAGNMMWRNLANYFPLQGVDALYDQNDLITHFEGAKDSLSYWGVADEYAFAMAEKLLKESTEPLFIAILTMTNHPPYKVPSHYVPKPLQASVLEGRYGKDNRERLATLGTYQYACDCLGGLITALEESGNIRHTIVAATGDHHLRGVSVNPPSELFLAKAVPFFVYLPQELKNQLSLDFDAYRVGSHKDIFPTLYHLSLSNTRYWHGCGRHLFEASTHYAFAYNETGLYLLQDAVIDISTQTGYAWQEDWRVGRVYTPSSDEMDKALAYQDFIRWQTNYLVTQASMAEKA